MNREDLKDMGTLLEKMGGDAIKRVCMWKGLHWQEEFISIRNRSKGSDAGEDILAKGLFPFCICVLSIQQTSWRSVGDLPHSLSFLAFRILLLGPPTCVIALGHSFFLVLHIIPLTMGLPQDSWPFFSPSLLTFSHLVNSLTPISLLFSVLITSISIYLD